MSVTVTVRLVVGILCFLLGASVVTGRADSLNHTSQNLTPYRTCTVTATPSTTTSVIDAPVQQGSPTSNFGTATTMRVSSSSGSGNQRVYIMFNLGGCNPAIPSTASVRLATLRLYVSTVASACRTIAVFRVTAAWTESVVTWNNQPFGTAINNPALGSATAQFNVGIATCTNSAVGYVTGATVTTDVAAFVAGTATNNGWMLRDSAEGSGTAFTNTFSAKNLGTLAQAPQLVVTYVSVP